jgi:hypothetical protein
LTDLHRLRPLPGQYREFGDYLPKAHSWYKHLSLLQGRRFVVFVAPDAGLGRLVVRLHGGGPETATGYTLETPPEGALFTEEHPRLHYGWKTTQEYRQRFGYLDYMCHDGVGQPYSRDAGPPVELPREVEEKCSFVLYPYVSGQFAEAVRWSVHEEALESLRAGATHPAREEVLELVNLAELQDAAWDALTEQEREWASTRRTQEQQSESPSAAVQNYFDLGTRITAISTGLHDQEGNKIRQALAELDDWLLQAEG